jgi:hypothetical protein
MIILTTSDFWDCECEHDYIHPSTEAFCKKCKTPREEGPDSRVEEVRKYFWNGISGQDRKFYNDMQDKESYISN